MENADNISSVWYCAGCQARKVCSSLFFTLMWSDLLAQHPPRKPTQSLFSPLVHVLNYSIPTEYQLPDEIRTFFKDGASLVSQFSTGLLTGSKVATNDKGAYVDNADLKPPRLK